jgi:hypothetical protein
MADHFSLPDGRIDEKKPQGNVVADNGTRTRMRTGTRTKTREGTMVPDAHKYKNHAPMDDTQGNDPRKKTTHAMTPTTSRLR